MEAILERFLLCGADAIMVDSIGRTPPWSGPVADVDIRRWPGTYESIATTLLVVPKWGPDSYPTACDQHQRTMPGCFRELLVRLCCVSYFPTVLLPVSTRQLFQLSRSNLRINSRCLFDAVLRSSNSSSTCVSFSALYVGLESDFVDESQRIRFFACPPTSTTERLSRRNVFFALLLAFTKRVNRLSAVGTRRPTAPGSHPAEPTMM
jgi:hypothetical protein